MTIRNNEIVRLKTVDEYEEAGDEITELVEKFAGHYGQVLKKVEEANEFGESTYAIEILNTGEILTITDHEIQRLYREC